MHRDARAVVPDQDLDTLPEVAGADGDMARTPGLLGHVHDGMGRVDHEVEQHLAHPLGRAEHARQARVEVHAHLGHVLPLVAGQGDRLLDQLVQVYGLVLVVAGVGELLDGIDDGRDAVQALQGLGDGRRQLLQIEGNLQLLFPGPHALPSRVSRPSRKLPIGLDGLPELLDPLLDEPHVVHDVLGGGVYLVGDARGQLPDGFQFLGLEELGFEHPAFGDVQDQQPETQRLAVGGLQRHGGDQGEADVPADVQAQVESRAGEKTDALVENDPEGRLVVFVHQGADGCSDEPAPVPVREPAEMVVAIADDALGIDLHQALAHVLGQAAEALLAAGQVFPCGAPAAHILDKPFEILDIALAVTDHPPAQPAPEHGTVPPPQLHVPGGDDALLQPLGDDRPPVLGIDVHLRGNIRVIPHHFFRRTEAEDGSHGDVDTHVDAFGRALEHAHRRVVEDALVLALDGRQGFPDPVRGRHVAGNDDLADAPALLVQQLVAAHQESSRQVGVCHGNVLGIELAAFQMALGAPQDLAAGPADHLSGREAQLVRQGRVGPLDHPRVVHQEDHVRNGVEGAFKLLLGPQDLGPGFQRLGVVLQKR